MENYGNAVLRYCPQIKQNVIIEEHRGIYGVWRFECLCKNECGYEKLGCRNRLLDNIRSRAEPVSAEAEV